MKPNEITGLAHVRRPCLALLGLASLALAACGGSPGKTTPGTPGPPGSGTPPPGNTVVIGYSKTINATITTATVPADGHVVVQLYLTDEHNQKLRGLPAGEIYFVLARLEPESNGKSSTWHSITRRQEQCTGSPPPDPAEFPPTPDTNPPLTCTAGTSVNQGYTERATAGTWVDHQDGTYQYTFLQSVLGISDIPYDQNLTHRVGLEIRTQSKDSPVPASIPANNALFDWIPYLVSPQPLTASGRTIVTNAECNACHDNLAMHGAARFDVNYCAMCHESYSYDAQTGNSLDFRVMIHKVHMGEKLPSVEAGGLYGIYGYGNQFVDFGVVVYPQDIRNCQTCHRENDADSPQGDAWRTTVNTNACGSCHDDVNFATGENHGNGVAATDEQCWTCHGPNSGMVGVQTASAHAIPTKVAAGDFKFEVVKVEAIKQDGTPGDTPCAPATAGCKVVPGEYVKLTIKVTNPRTGATWKLTDPPFTNVAPCTPTPCTPTSARLRARVAYTTQNLTNPGTGNDPSLPIELDYLSAAAAPPGTLAIPGGPPVRNADDTYTMAGATPIPGGLVGGSGVAYLEGRTIVDVDPSPSVTKMARVGVTASAGVSYPITDVTAVPPRQVVDIARCDECHNRLLFHGDARNDNTGLCATCHNPNFASGTTAATGQPWDFKVLIHALHASTYSYGGVTLPPIQYPGYVQNCEGCHKPGTYYPVDPTVVFATSIDEGADPSSPSDDTAITPNSAVCSSCHTSSDVRLHMELKGGSFNATKNANGTSDQAAAESCGACHGAGGPADVKVMHHIDDYRYNN